MLAQLSIQVSPLWPLWLVLAVAAALFLATVYGTAVLVRRKVRPRWVALLGALRLAVLAVLVAALLQPTVSYTQTTEPLPEILVLVDTSKSMTQPSGSGTRLEEVVSVLQKGAFAATLRSRFRPRWFRFDDTASPLEESELSRLQATGTATRIAQSLTDACNLLRAEGQAPRRVLLVSDGNDRGSADPVEAARRLGVVVDVLAPTGKATAARGVEIADVQGARRVLLGSETHFRLSLRDGQAADRDRTFSLRLLEDGKKVQELPLVLKGGRAEQAFLLAHRPASTGAKRYTFDVRAPAGEVSPAAKELNVQVVDSKYEILVLEDTWRWDYKFLHRLFEEDPSFRFTALLPRGGGAFVQFGSPDRRVNLVGFPQSRAELEGFDLFFLGDVDPARWPRGLPASLAQLVTEEGKSLVVIAGPGLGRLADIPELHALLPVDLTRASGNPVGGPVEVRLRPDAAQSPFFFQLRADEAKLPAVDQIYPVLRKRPAATVLLEAVKQRNAYGNQIVLAEHTVGRGRVLFVGTDTLWKWHTLTAGEGASPYGIFWQQALRALTPARTRQGSVSLWLTPSRTQGEVGRKFDLEAEAQSDRPLVGARIQAIAALPDGRRLPLSFAADPTNPRRFRAEMSPSLPGAYRVTATLVAEGKTVTEGTTAFQVEAPRAEQDDRGVDRAGLSRLAAATGGRTLDPARPESWPSAEGPSAPAVQRQRTVDLWDNFALLFVLCGLLGADWLIRLFKGLV